MDKRAKFSGRGFPLQTWRQAVQLVCLLLAQLFWWFSNHVSISVLQPFAQHLKFWTLCLAFALCSLHAQQSLVTLHLQSHYLFVPPLLNPIIYTNETREIHKEIIRIISQNNIWACPDQPQSAAPPTPLRGGLRTPRAVPGQLLDGESCSLVGALEMSAAVQRPLWSHPVPVGFSQFLISVDVSAHIPCASNPVLPFPPRGFVHSFTPRAQWWSEVFLITWTWPPNVGVTQDLALSSLWAPTTFRILSAVKHGGPSPFFEYWH